MPGIGSAHRAGREDHVRGVVGLIADRDVALGGQLSLTLDQIDLVVLEEAGDAAGQALADLLAALVELRPVERDVGGDDPDRLAVSGLLVDLGGAEQRLRRDAGVVEAAAAGLVLLDDGRLQAELGGADRSVIAARSGADNDHVVLRGICHGGDSTGLAFARPARASGSARAPSP